VKYPGVEQITPDVSTRPDSSLDARFLVQVDVEMELYARTRSRAHAKDLIVADCAEPEMRE
jgi:hypothetical protein